VAISALVADRLRVYAALEGRPFHPA
jgi:hypothetical protein